MKQIPISDLTPGMVTADDILTYDMRPIVPKGVVLTENIISRLESYAVYYVNIEDDIVSELSKPMSMTKVLEGDAPSGQETVRANSRFRQFEQDFNKCAEHFRNNLMKSLYHDEPFYVNELLSETMQLMYQKDSYINVFDMLLGMRNVDDSVYNHCLDVALICNVLARWLHFTDEEQTMATACGLFHDVGKFLLPASVLRKPGKLTPSEFEIIKTHTIEGFHLLGKYSNIPMPVKNAALMHHEKCDGSGYPYGLTEDEIDKFAKIVTIADIFDAMTSDRVYRKALCPFSVIKAFEDEGICKYDPHYILTFLENVSNSYLNHHVTLTNGMEGDIIFINQTDLSHPVIRTNDNRIIDLQKQYYENMLRLANHKNVSIETIL